MRTFASLTRGQNIVSIVLNSVIHNRASDILPTRPEDTNETAHTPWLRAPQNVLDAVNHPSIFGSHAFKPALGRSFSHCVDLHILLGKLPKRPHDARLLMSETSQTTNRLEMIDIAEVILDRWGGRVGLWSGFSIVNGAELKLADN
jgi:hypothetical protein